MATDQNNQKQSASVPCDRLFQQTIAVQLDQVGRLREKNPKVARMLCQQIIQRLRPDAPPSLWAKAYMQLAHTLLYSGLMKSVVEVCRKSEPIIEKLDSTGHHYRCMLYAAFGAAYAFLGQIEKSLHYSQKLVDLAKGMENERELCRAYLNMGTVHSFIEDYPLALTFYSLALQLAEKNGEMVVEATTLHNMSILYLNMEHCQEALVFAERAHTIQTRLGSLPAIAQSLLTIASIYDRNQQYDCAMSYVRKAHRIAHGCGEHRVVAHCLSLRGWLCLKLNQYKQALRWFRKACTLWKNVDPTTEYPHILEGMATAYMKFGKPRAAQKLFLRLVEYATQRNVPSAAVNSCYALHELAKSNGDVQAALYWFEQYHHWYARWMDRTQLDQVTRQIMVETMARLSREHENYRTMLVELGTLIEKQRQEIARLTVERIVHLHASAASERNRTEPTFNPGNERRTCGQISSQDLSIIIEKFDYIHPGYINALRARVPSLTRTELLICVLLCLQFRTKEIAHLLKITPRTVFHHRENIRHKCGLDPKANLTVFLCSIGSEAS